MIRDYKTSGKEHISDPEPRKDDPYGIEEFVREEDGREDLIEDDPEDPGRADDERAEDPEEMPSDHTGQLNYLRERTREAEEAAKSPASQLRAKERNRDRLRWILVLLSLFSAAAAAAALYFTNYRYTTYSVDESFTLGSASGASVFKFRDGNLIISTDAVTFVRKGGVQWTAAVGVSDPVFAAEGAYFALTGRGGYEFFVFNESGMLSTVRVSRKIRSLDVSAAGVVAVCTESSDTAYVSYFDRYGSRINVEVKTILDASGYPVSIALSPDGNKLLVVYYSIANGIGESRLVVYDFENGKADRSYIVTAYEDFYATGTYLADCDFIDDHHAIAVGTNRAVFLTDFVKGNVNRKNVTLSGDVRSLVFNGSGLTLVTEEGDRGVCTFYGAEGDVRERFNCPTDYETLIADGKRILFQKNEEIVYFNASGVERYEGALTYEPVSIAFAGSRSLFLNTGGGYEKITLK